MHTDDRYGSLISEDTEEEQLSEDEIEAQSLLDAERRTGTEGTEAGAETDAEGYAEVYDAGTDTGTDTAPDTDTASDTDGDTGESGADSGSDDSRMLQMYLDELQEIEPISEKELEILVKRSHDGDLTARNRIVEGHLKYALSVLWEYLNRGVELTELISETNVALINAVDGYTQGDLKESITRAIREAALRLIKEDGQIHAQDEDLARRVNELSDLSVEMVQELGRRPTNAELAHRLNISEEVVESLIRMSIDAL